MSDYDLIIIWWWSAGLPAGMYASRYKLKNIIIWEMLWWALATSHCVENWPWVLSAHGDEIMKSFREHAESSWSGILQDRVEKIEILSMRSFRIMTQLGKSFTTQFILLATGNSYRHLGVPWEQEFLGKGVSYCATCDGNFFRNSIVSVVGGWNTAITEALYLAEIAKEVHILIRSDRVRAEDIWMDKVHARGNISVHYNTSIKMIEGNTMGMTSLILSNGSTLLSDWVFIAVWTHPNTALVDQLWVEKDTDWTIRIDSRQETNISWLFAAWDVTNGSNKFRQTIMSAAEWCLAAHCIHEDMLRFGKEVSN